VNRIDAAFLTLGFLAIVIAFILITANWA